MTGGLRHGARIEAVRAAAAGGAPGASDGATRRALRAEA